MNIAGGFCRTDATVLLQSEPLAKQILSAYEKRLRLIEGLAKSELPMNKMIIGTGSTSIADSVELSRTALKAGANGILMLPPFYYKNPTENGLFQLL